jgi:hypothetical protein
MVYVFCAVSVSEFLFIFEIQELIRLSRRTVNGTNAAPKKRGSTKFRADLFLKTAITILMKFGNYGGRLQEKCGLHAGGVNIASSGAVAEENWVWGESAALLFD